jgi:hypothetical protein
MAKGRYLTAPGPSAGASAPPGQTGRQYKYHSIQIKWDNEGAGMGQAGAEGVPEPQCICYPR